MNFGEEGEEEGEGDNTEGLLTGFP